MDKEDQIFTVEEVAQVCHEANKVLCELSGDDSQEAWELADDWQKNSAVNGVAFHLTNPNVSASASHNNWKKDKVTDGWVYGRVKDVEKKTHPCMVDYDKLPSDQRVKDYLFKGIVNSLRDFIIQ